MKQSRLTIRQLEIDLNHPYSLNDFYSKLIIEPINFDESSSLGIKELSLQPQTQVNHLSYNPQGNQLDFALQKTTENTQPNSAIDPEANVLSNSNLPRDRPLQLSLSETPLKIIVEGYQSPDIETSPEEDNKLEFIWTPWSTQLDLSLPEEAKLNLTLANLQSTNLSEWFWGELSVTDVKFSKTLGTEDVPEKLPISTILKGYIRLGEKELNLNKNQFLIFTDERRIKQFPHLQIHPNDPAGLEIRIHGKANKIEVGFDRDLPVSQVTTNIWERLLPENLINILLTFCAVAIGYLLPWMFTQNH